MRCECTIMIPDELHGSEHISREHAAVRRRAMSLV